VRNWVAGSSPAMTSSMVRSRKAYGLQYTQILFPVGSRKYAP
jgi:hypothetical protein